MAVIGERHGVRSTLITSQLPLESWHDFIADGTLADAILDRLVHNPDKIKMKGIDAKMVCKKDGPDKMGA